MGKSIEELASWEDVNRCLKEIGECEIAIKSLEADNQRRINDIRAEGERLGRPLEKMIIQLKAQINHFADSRKSELNGKTIKLTFGRVGYRQTSNIDIPEKMLAKVVQNLKKFGMGDCVNSKESVNKELLKRYSDSDIVKIGASRNTEDKFWCKAKQEKLRG